MSQFHSAQSGAQIRVGDFDGFTAPPELKNLLSPHEQEALSEISTPIVYRQGGLNIFSESEDAHFVYVVDKGVIRIVCNAENGQRQIVAFMLPGDLFGLPDDGVYANSAETVSAAHLYQIPWRTLVQRMIEVPQLQQNLLARVASDLHRAQRRIMSLGQQSTIQQLASLLLEFLRHPEFFNERGCYLHLPINRYDLADYLGVARETAARAITRLECDGLVRRIDSKTIQILDIAGLTGLQPGILPFRQPNPAR